MSLALAITLSLLAARRHSVAAPPLSPPCTAVTGSPAVAFTHDEGRFITRPVEPLTGIGYTYGLAALDTPHTLLSWFRDTIAISNDDGCSWRAIGSMSADFPPSIVAARGGRAYAWSDNREFLARYDGNAIKSLKSPGTLTGLGVDPDDGTHLRAGTSEGAIWESRDSGDTWSRIGAINVSAPIVYRTAFDPSNLDHIVVGTAVSGALTSFDGGRTWSGTSDRRNVFNIVIAPSNASIVWAMGIELADSSKHIYRSVDGGVTFNAVVDQKEGVTLINGPVMAVHPRDANILYFVFGTSFQNYGTDLFRYDASTSTLTVAHNDFDDIDSIAFSRSDPGLMYLGLETQRGIQ